MSTKNPRGARRGLFFEMEMRGVRKYWLRRIPSAGPRAEHGRPGQDVEEQGEGERKLITMRYSTAPALYLTTSWLTQRTTAFVVPSGTTSGYGVRASSHQLCSRPAQGRSVSTGIGRPLPGLKRRVATVMSTGDGARWAPIPNVPNMKVSKLDWLSSAHVCALRSRH